MQFNRENGEVNFIVRKIDSNIEIIVKDNGIGISEEDLPKLFEEFSRIKTSETRDIAGTGLGLSITKKMVELYRGSIEVNSKPGIGTTFTIVLPIA